MAFSLSGHSCIKCSLLNTLKYNIFFTFWNFSSKGLQHCTTTLNTRSVAHVQSVPSTVYTSTFSPFHQSVTLIEIGTSHICLNFARENQQKYLLEKVSWSGMTPFKADLTATRTRQLCDAMTVTKDLMANLLLAAGGRSGISIGGGGSNGELTNWDGTKKRNGWGVS